MSVLIEAGARSGEPRRPGRPALTSAALLLDAADEIGFTGLTIGVVTDRCGVKYSTFYRYFPSLEAFVAAAVERTLSAAPFPGDDLAWRPRLERTVEVLAGVLADHPGLAQAILGLSRRPAVLDRVVREVIDTLRAAGFHSDDAETGVSTAVEVVLSLHLVDRPVDRAVSAARLLCDGLASRCPSI